MPFVHHGRTSTSRIIMVPTFLRIYPGGVSYRETFLENAIDGVIDGVIGGAWAFLLYFLTCA